MLWQQDLQDKEWSIKIILTHLLTKDFEDTKSKFIGDVIINPTLIPLSSVLMTQLNVGL